MERESELRPEFIKKMEEIKKQPSIKVDDFAGRVTRIEIPVRRQEAAVKQLGLIEEQKFDKSFRAPRKEELKNERRTLEKVRAAAR